MKKYTFTLFVLLSSLAIFSYAQTNVLSNLENSQNLAREYMSVCLSENPTEPSQCTARCIGNLLEQNTCTNIQQSFQQCWVAVPNAAYQPWVPAFMQPNVPQYLPKPSVQSCVNFAVNQ